MLLSYAINCLYSFLINNYNHKPNNCCFNKIYFFLFRFEDLTLYILSNKIGNDVQGHWIHWVTILFAFTDKEKVEFKGRVCQFFFISEWDAPKYWLIASFQRYLRPKCSQHVFNMCWTRVEHSLYVNITGEKLSRGFQSK